MKIKKLTIRKPKIPFDGIIVFLILFFNNETLSNNLCLFMEQPTRIVTFAAVLYALYRIIRYRDLIKVKVALFSLLLIALVIVALIIDGSYTNGYMLLIMGILNGTILALFIPFERFSELFIKATIFMSAASLLFTYILKPVMRFFPFLFPRVTNSAGIVFYDAHICYVNTSARFFRNYGIFREPGIFAIVLCFSIVLVIFAKPKNFSRKKTLIYFSVFAITLISTFSTTGYVAALLIALAAMISQNNRGVSRSSIIMVIAFVALVVVYLFFFENLENPFEKFNNTSDSYSSYRYRIETIVNGTVLSLRQPMGYGLQKGIYALQNANSLKSYHNTSTWIAMSVYLGIPYFLLCLVSFLGFFVKKTKSMIVFLPFFLLLSGEAMLYNAMIYAFIMYGMTAKVSISEQMMRSNKIVR